MLSSIFGWRYSPKALLGNSANGGRIATGLAPIFSEEPLSEMRPRFMLNDVVGLGVVGCDKSAVCLAGTGGRGRAYTG